MSQTFNEQFFQKLLQNTGEKQVKIVDISSEPAVAEGEHYLSRIDRFTVKYEQNGVAKQNSFIVKQPTNLEDVFHNEISVYENFLPKLQQIQSKHLKNQHFLFPKYYKTNSDVSIVLEDLSNSSYKMCDRQMLLDYNHSACVLKSLASFHALSIKLQNKHPKLVKLLKPHQWDISCYQYSNQVFASFKTLVEEWPQTDSIGALYKLLENSYNKILYVNDCASDWVVLSHSDLWINNVLFKYEHDGDVAHVQLIDYQFTHFSSIAFDLLSFLFTSVQVDVLKTKFDELISTYHEHLLDNLKQLKLESKCITLDKLHKELQDKSYFGLFYCLITLPLCFKTQDGGDDDDCDHYNKNPRLKEVVRDYIDVMIDKGYLESALNKTNHIGESGPVHICICPPHPGH